MFRTKNVTVLHYDKDDIPFMHSSVVDPDLCGLLSGLSLQPGQFSYPSICGIRVFDLAYTDRSFNISLVYSQNEGYTPPRNGWADKRARPQHRWGGDYPN